MKRLLYMAKLILITISALGMSEHFENNGNNENAGVTWDRRYPIPPECVSGDIVFYSNPVFYLPVCMKEPPKEEFVVVSREYIKDLWLYINNLSNERDRLEQDRYQLSQQVALLQERVTELKMTNDRFLSIIEQRESELTNVEDTDVDSTEIILNIVESESITGEGGREEKSPNKEMEEEIETEVIDITKDRKLTKDKLLQAVKLGEFTEVIQLLSDDITIIDELDEEGNNTLILAAKEGNLKLVKYLIKQGADINHVNNEGRNALMYAAINGRVKAFKELIKQNEKDVNLKDKEGKTLLVHIVTMDYENEGIRGKLLDLLFKCKELEINDTDKKGNTALMYALSNRDHETVKLLLTQNALDVNKANKKNCRPLTICLENEDFDTSWRLLDKGADINKEKEKYGKKKIYQGLLACFNIMSEMRKENYDEALFWMKESVDISKIKGNIGPMVYEAIPFIFNALVYPEYVNLEGVTEHHTALIYAIRLGEYQIVERLLKKNANVDDVTVMYAEKSGSKKMIELVNSFLKKGNK